MLKKNYSELWENKVVRYSLGAVALAAGAYLYFGRRKVTTGDKLGPPKLTEEEMKKTADKFNKATDDQYYPLFKDFEGLNLDHLRRKRAF
jgi:hypothetical protein